MKTFEVYGKCDCGGHKLYWEKYDVFFCAKCDTWLEGRCPDKKCEFCGERPEKPSVALQKNQ